MAGESGGFRQLERVNRRRTATLVAKLILVLAAFGLILDFLFGSFGFSYGQFLGFPWFATAAVALGVALAMRANISGADIVLGSLRAHPISSDQPNNQAVIDVVHEIALAARIPPPRIYVIDDRSPNAFAIGRDPEHSVICVTQGLLDQMDREELQGVIGHEMAHIRNCDTRLTTMVTAMFGGFGVFSGRLISILLSREREYLADASAVEFTRNPAALVRALEHIARTESPLTGATPGTAQLFIVDPLQSASGGGGRSYEEFINEVTRIRSQPGKTEAQRDDEARNFAAREYPRNAVLEKISSHPPLADRIKRLQALIHASPDAAPASGLSDDQMQAKFSESAQFVRDAASTDPQVLAKVMESALIASAGGRELLQNESGTQLDPDAPSRDPIEQQLYEANLASTGDLQRARKSGPTQRASGFMSLLRGASKPNESLELSAPPAPAPAIKKSKGTGPLDPSAHEEQEREALEKMLAPVAATMLPKEPAAAQRPPRSAGTFLFWLVIALSAGAIVATLASR